MSRLNRHTTNNNNNTQIPAQHEEELDITDLLPTDAEIQAQTLLAAQQRELQEEQYRLSQSQGIPLSAADFDATGNVIKNNSSETQTIVTMLRSSYLNERSAPELLIYEEDIINRIKEMIQVQQQQIMIMSAESQNSSDSGSQQFLHNLLQMEIDRINYLLHSYARCRLKKIEKFILFICQNEEEMKKLSKEESDFAFG